MKKLLSIVTMAVFALALTVSPALARGGHGGHGDDGNDVTVMNSNSAVVVNHVEAEAETGENTAGGSSGGNGGNGGNIEAKGDDAEVEDSSTGNGGTGGNGGPGGTVLTGNASARAGVINKVNENKTVVDLCACDEDDDEGDVKVVNRSRAKVINKVEAEAETGENEAMGSTGGNAGNGGNIKADGDGDEAEVEDSTTGTGGNGGTGDEGGWVDTGNATAKAGVVNIIGRNRTLIRR